MCGICGHYRASLAHDPFAPMLIESMTHELLHRGPDGCDTWTNAAGTAAIGQTRLAIIDLYSGDQPMHSINGQLVIVFNGEIYNYRGLRVELEHAGWRFATQSDTEVLLNGFLEWGAGLFGRLHGMFALAIYDKSAHRLTLARDPVGIKPLYISLDEGRLLFASEIKSLFKSELPRKLNYGSLVNYLVFGYPTPEDTFFEDIFELQPGSWLAISAAGVERGAFWEWERREQDWSREDALQATEQALTDSLREHLEADVPIAAFLSGGIDSSLLSALLVKKLDVQLDTFNVRFDDDSFDESAHAQSVASHLGTRHHTLDLGAFRPDLPTLRSIMQQFDQPFADSSAIPTNLISRAVREHVKVVIGGDGGDEMFGGYARFRHADLARRMGRAPGPLLTMARWANQTTKPFTPDRWRQGSRILHAAKLCDGNRLTQLSAYHPPWTLVDLLQASAFDRAEPFISTLINEGKRINDPDGSDYLDLTVETALPGDYLRKVDVMSAAHGLEARVPFLGSQVLALSQTLPKHLRYSRRQNKLLLRALAGRFLPEAIVARPKAGFNLPFDTWLGESERKQLHAELTAADAPIQTLVRSEWIGRVAGEFAFGPRDRSRWSRFGLYQRAFMLWVLNNWLEQWQPELS